MTTAAKVPPIAAALLLLTVLVPACANPGPPPPAITVLKVGPGAPYARIAAAVAFANADKDPSKTYVVEVASGTYANDFVEVTRPMTIEAAGPGSVVLNATQTIPNEKGIIYATANLTVKGLTFRGARIADNRGGNGAGIRDQNITPNGWLTVENSNFENNQTGILTDPRANTMTITIQNDKFRNNGNPQRHAHALYVNGGVLLTVADSQFCGQLGGHDVKSRAAATTVQNSELYDGAAAPALGCNATNTALAIDVSNGGKATITGNKIVQGPASPNFGMVSYGAEGLAYKDNSLVVSHNTFASPGTPHSTAVFDRFCVGAQLIANTYNSIRTVIGPPDCFAK